MQKLSALGWRVLKTFGENMSVDLGKVRECGGSDVTVKTYLLASIGTKLLNPWFAPS